MDRRVARPFPDPSEWQAVKPKTPFGHLPMLEVRDEADKLVLTLAQSQTIARYLARQFGLAGQNAQEQSLAEMYCDQLHDMGYAFIQDFFNVHQASDAVRQSKLDKYFTETVPTEFARFEAQLERNNTGFLVGQGMTWADLQLFRYLDLLLDKRDSILALFPRIKQLVEDKIEKSSRLTEYLANRAPENLSDSYEKVKAFFAKQQQEKR